jgi:hypothetical protein
MEKLNETEVGFTNTHILMFLQAYPSFLEYAYVDADDGELQWKNQYAWRSYAGWMYSEGHITKETFKVLVMMLDGDLTD